MKKNFFIVIGILLMVNLFHSGWRALNPIIKEQVIEGTEISNLKVEVRNSQVELLPSSDSQIKIVAQGAISRTLDFGIEDSALTINTYRHPLGLTNLIPKGKDILTIYLPKKQFESISILSRNGAVIVNELNVEQLDVSNRNGRIELENLEINQTIVSSRNGRIELKNIDGNQITVSSRNGRIELENIEANQTTVSTRNGRVNIEEVSGDFHIGTVD